MRPSLLLPCLLLATAVVGQPALPEVGAVVPGRFIVLFADGGADLRILHRAYVERAPAEEVDAVVAALDRQVRAARAGFVAAVEALGGRVTARWWIINGAAVEIDAAKAGALAALPGVVRVVRQRYHLPTLGTATDAQHHDSDRANQRTVGGVPLRGAGVSVAVLDTGVDADVAGLGRPHRGYYPGGDPNNTTGGGLGGSRLLAALVTSYRSVFPVMVPYSPEDLTFDGHGTHVSGCVGANAHANVDDAPAPDAGIVGIKISDDFGCAFTEWLVSGWQTVAAEAARYGIRVACNPYTGFPNMFEPIQMALDTTAYVADIAVCVSSGNFATNTAFSQRAYNGVAVGSVQKFSMSGSGYTVSSFSGRGILSSTAATYPDLVGVGESVVATNADNEAVGRVATGTSFATPIVAGIVALIRQAAPALDARETMAVLLDTALPSGPRTQAGLGFAHADRAVVAAMSGDVFSAQVSVTAPVFESAFMPPAGPHSVTVFYMRAGGAALPANLDVSVFDADGQLVATDGNPENNYEQVTFTASGGPYRLKVVMQDPGSHTAVDFAVAGAGATAVLPPPAVAAVSPPAVSTYQPPEVVLTGQNLGFVTAVTVGGVPVSFTVDAATRLRLRVGSPFTIGTHPVVLRGLGGNANATLSVIGQQPPRLVAPPTAGRTADLDVYHDVGRVAFYLVSPSLSPSRLPGIVDLGIGNGFSSLFGIGSAQCDLRGFARLPLFVPGPRTTATLHFQVITVDPNAPVLPLEVTNVVTTSFF